MSERTLVCFDVHGEPYAASIGFVRQIVAGVRIEVARRLDEIHGLAPQDCPDTAAGDLERVRAALDQVRLLPRRLQLAKAEIYTALEAMQRELATAQVLGEELEPVRVPGKRADSARVGGNTS